MTTKLSTDLAAHIEGILDAIEELENEKLAVDDLLSSKMYEYKIALAAIEYWEDTGLEKEIDSLEGKSSSLDNSIEFLERRLNNARLV